MPQHFQKQPQPRLTAIQVQTALDLEVQQEDFAVNVEWSEMVPSADIYGTHTPPHKEASTLYIMQPLYMWIMSNSGLE